MQSNTFISQYQLFHEVFSKNIKIEIYKGLLDYIKKDLYRVITECSKRDKRLYSTVSILKYFKSYNHQI